MIQNYYELISNLKSLNADEFSNSSSEKIDCDRYRLQTGILNIYDNITNLKKKLNKRYLKRLKIRRTKTKIRENATNRRIKLHAEIGSSLEQLAENSTIQLQEKSNIEYTKWKVRYLDNKIENSINKLSILNGLKALRTLRKNRSVTFLEEPRHVDYNCDETLQKNLNAHISNLQTMKKQMQKSESHQEVESRFTPDLCENLFGDRNFQLNPLDRMSIDELIESRKYWDQFIVGDNDPDGSYIPKYWVGEGENF